MKKALIFDLDDTLIREKDYIKSGFEVVALKIAKHNDLNSNIILEIMNEQFKKNPKNVFNKTLENLDINYKKEDIQNLIKVYRTHIPKISFYEDVIGTLKELKKRKYKLGIITDGYKESQRKKIEALKCKDIFDEIIITDELGEENWKPSKIPYECMSKKLGVKNKECAYIGDNLLKDFQGGKELGWMNIFIKREEGVYKNINKNKDLIHMEIKSLKELLIEFK